MSLIEYMVFIVFFRFPAHSLLQYIQFSFTRLTHHSGLNCTKVFKPKKKKKHTTKNKWQQNKHRMFCTRYIVVSNGIHTKFGTLSFFFSHKLSQRTNTHCLPTSENYQRKTVKPLHVIHNTCVNYQSAFDTDVKSNLIRKLLSKFSRMKLFRSASNNNFAPIIHP